MKRWKNSPCRSAGSADAVRLGDGPVEVPLDVRDRGAGEDVGQDVEQVVDDLRARHVQDELLAALGPWPAGDPDRPVRVRLEQAAAPADHLGLDPEAEPETEGLDLRGDAVEAVRQLSPVHEPVAERRVVRVTLAEPAIVEDEQLDPEIAGGRRDLDQLRFVEVEVGRLPVVEDDRPRCVAPPPARQPLAVQAVERLAHRAEPGIRVDQHRLGCLEVIPGFECPGERVRADADANAGRVVRIHLRLGDEVP